jgi:hypothetical protein
MWRRPLGLVIAIGLGIAGGLALDSLQAKPEAPIAAAPERELDPEALRRVEALRDEALALTAAEVALDDPATPDPIRTELLATIAALECVGVLGHDGPHPRATSCVTLER